MPVDASGAGNRRGGGVEEREPMRRQCGWAAVAVLLAAAILAGCGDDGNGADDAHDAVDAADDGAFDLADGGDDAAPEDDAAAELPEDVLADVPEDDGVAPSDPAAPGPYTWTTVDETLSRGSRSIPVSALIPDLADGATAPLVVFLPGFQLRTAFYMPYVERLASHGLIVVRADPPGSLLDNSHLEQTLDAQAVLDWALDGAGPVGPRVDPTRVAMSGHSNGGKISVMTAFADPRVTALLALDPVNGSGPMGYTAERPDIVPAQVETLAIPLGFMGETLDATASGLGQACAPAAQNFLTFYDAAAASPWATSWEFEGANHMVFVFDTSTCGFACGLCRAGTADTNVVHDTILVLAVAFFRLHFLGDAEMERRLTGDLLPGGVLMQHKP
jgi:chlorophyllase